MRSQVPSEKERESYQKIQKCMADRHSEGGHMVQRCTSVFPCTKGGVFGKT